MQRYIAGKRLKVINSEGQFGCFIEPGNSRLHTVLHNFKLRVDAAFHDACVLTRTQYNLGPGYIYAVGEKSIFKYCCLLGQVTGLSVWIYLNLTMSETQRTSILSRRCSDGSSLLSCFQAFIPN